MKNKFNKDTRYKEVEYLLDPSVDMVLKQQDMAGPDQNALSDEEKIKFQKLLLEKLFKRQLSKCVGKGALTLGIQETIPTETLQIAKISQIGHIPHNQQGDGEEVLLMPCQNTISLSLQEREEREMVQWP